MKSVITNQGTALLVALYYVVGMILYNHSFEWPLFDALSVVTMNLSFFGRATYMTTHHTRLICEMFSILGNALSIFLCCVFVNFELSSARAYVKDIKNENQDSTEVIRQLHKRRVFMPLVKLATVVAVGSYFFAHNEYWAVSDALCFAVMHHVSVGSQGWPEHSLLVVHGTTKPFLLVYTWLFSIAAMHVMGNLCAYHLEWNAAMKLKIKLDLSGGVADQPEAGAGMDKWMANAGMEEARRQEAHNSSFSGMVSAAGELWGAWSVAGGAGREGWLGTIRDSYASIPDKV